MTLVAAFRAHGVPVLIGDFLITLNGDRVSLRKKVHLVRPNLAIAWTGHLLAAERVLPYLDRALPQGTVSRARLLHCLTTYDATELASLQVTLVGWVVDDSPLCFRWNSSFASEVFPAEPAYDGSGAAVIQRFAGPRGLVKADDSDAVALDDAIAGTLYVTTHLMQEEMSPSGAALTFGHSYEVLYWREPQFEYLDDILYLSLDAHVTADDRVTHYEVVGNIYKYRAAEANHSITHSFHREEDERRIHIITPVGLSSLRMGEQLLSSTFQATRGHFPVESRYYCAFIRFISSTTVVAVMSLIYAPPAEADKRWIDGEAGSVVLRIPIEFMNSAYQTILADQRESNSPST